jgi:hypothetical protein
MLISNRAAGRRKIYGIDIACSRYIAHITGPSGETSILEINIGRTGLCRCKNKSVEKRYKASKFLLEKSKMVFINMFERHVHSFCTGIYLKVDISLKNG